MPDLTSAQYTALRVALIADATVQSFLNSSQYQRVADVYNALASPAFWAYRIGIESVEVGRVINYVAVAAMTTANLQRVSDFLRLNPSTFNGRDDIKQFLSDTFSGALGGQGQATRDALDLMLRRQVTKAERVFVTGTGTTVAPGTFAWEGTLAASDVDRAVNQGA